jgi:hypothetical protein
MMRRRLLWNEFLKNELKRAGIVVRGSGLAGGGGKGSAMIAARGVLSSHGSKPTTSRLPSDRNAPRSGSNSQRARDVETGRTRADAERLAIFGANVGNIVSNGKGHQTVGPALPSAEALSDSVRTDGQSFWMVRGNSPNSSAGVSIRAEFHDSRRTVIAGAI